MPFVAPEKKIMTLSEAVLHRERLRAKKITVSLTNGCFDLLHRGHAVYLQQARDLADTLFVLINSDRSVRELKGPSRPVNCEYDRAYLLACFSFVDVVVIFDGVRCARELSVLTPDFYAKGGDYTIDTLDPAERDALLNGGAAISFIPFVPDHSTSAMLDKIASAKNGQDGPEN